MKKIERCCPQCGALPEDVEVCCFGKMFFVCCYICGAETDVYLTQDEAVEDWNRGTARGSNIE